MRTPRASVRATTATLNQRDITHEYLCQISSCRCRRAIRAWLSGSKSDALARHRRNRHSSLQGRNCILRQFKEGCLLWSWRGEDLGYQCGRSHSRASDHCEHRTLTREEQHGGDREASRRCRAGLGEYRQQSVSLLRQPLVWKDQTRRIHVGAGREDGWLPSGGQQDLRGISALRWVGMRRRWEAAASQRPVAPTPVSVASACRYPNSFA